MSLISIIRRYQKKKRRIYEYYDVNPKASIIYESLKMSRGQSNTFYNEVVEYVLPLKKVNYFMLQKKYKLSSKRTIEILSLLLKDQILLSEQDTSFLENLLL